MLEIVVVAVLPALVVTAAVADLITMTIPNRLVLALVAAFLAAAPLSGMGWAEIGAHFAAALLVLAIGFALFAPGWIGGGDAKLAAAIALWLGFEPLLTWFVVFAMLGGALTIGMLWYRERPLHPRLVGVGWLARLHSPACGVPYGIALSAGALALWTETPWFSSLV